MAENEIPWTWVLLLVLQDLQNPKEESPATYSED
jgi:hypothetical protein